MDASDSARITNLTPMRAVLGESPIWLPERRAVLWVDMPVGKIHVTALATGETETISTPSYLGAAAPSASGGFVVAAKEGFAEVAATGEYTPVWSGLHDTERMNDAQCDSFGRMWAGSLDVNFAPGLGELWRWERGSDPVLVLDALTQPNGLGWSPDGSTFYLVDSAEAELTAFDADPSTGTISNRRLLKSFPPSSGIPDGLCVDSEGSLWIALWGGSAITRISPDGDELASIRLPVRLPTSCAFVGSQLGSLVVTSAREAGADNDHAPGGELLVVEIAGVQGLQTHRFGNHGTDQPSGGALA